VKRSPDSHERTKPDRPDEQPTSAGTEEGDIDQILADSFPANDAPPWTLGITQSPPNDEQTRRRNRGNR
jgi:hypothetical protein